MEELLNKLRELGVFIPEGLDDAQLTNLAKALCPWTMTIEPEMPGMFMAYTSKSHKPSSVAIAETPALAGMLLIWKQLHGKLYSAHDTAYKQNAARQRN